ncbi:DMT family transporter [Telmatospirillum sp.]|uniref:DMT family transporter n=1 Tax=Telmatospirillum sp. TaxID=2079197 RepID=UPI002851B811|nr:DMT family transporter [Telmatospirillum sp.]MDR3436129.1 DMT family transporter [Telmatospirillum sp.]
MNRLTANSLMVLTAVIWGVGFVAQKVAADHIGPTTFIAARLFLGALVVLPVAVLHWRARQAAVSLKDWAMMAMTGLIMCGASITQQLGVAETTVANTGFLTGLYVPLVPLIELIILRKKPHPIIWPAAALSVLGTTLMSGGGELAFGWGDAQIIVSSVFWAAHIIMVGYCSNRTGLPTVLAVVQYLVCATICSLWAAAFEPAIAAGLVAAWKEIAFIGVLEVGLAYTLQAVVQRHTGAADAAILLSSEVLFTMLSGMIFLGERMSLTQVVGGLAILAAMLAVQLGPLLSPGRFLERVVRRFKGSTAGIL